VIPRDQIEIGALAGSVGADNSVDVSPHDLKAHISDRKELAEFFGY
jgi:hypothetical protein